MNSSSYKMVPRSATIGTATADPVAYEEIMAAIGTGSLDHVMNVIALLTQPLSRNSRKCQCNDSALHRQKEDSGHLRDSLFSGRISGALTGKTR